MSDLETLLARYAIQDAEWQKIRDELVTAAGKGIITAYQVTLTQKKRMLARGERLITYEELEKAHEEAQKSPENCDHDWGSVEQGTCRAVCRKCGTSAHAGNVIATLQYQLSRLTRFERVIPPPDDVAGCVCCDTCSGFRTPGHRCAFCAAKLQKVDLLEQCRESDKQALGERYDRIQALEAQLMNALAVIDILDPPEKQSERRPLHPDVQRALDYVRMARSAEGAMKLTEPTLCRRLYHDPLGRRDLHCVDPPGHLGHYHRAVDGKGRTITWKSGSEFDGGAEVPK